MNDQELLATVAWNYLTEPGDRVAGELIQVLGARESLDRLLTKNCRQVGNLVESDLKTAFERWYPRLEQGKAQSILLDAKRKDIFPILPSSELWPSALNALGEHAPLVIWYRGNISRFASLSRAVGVVGSRTVTHYGQSITADLVEALVENEATVISGGALGVDTLAHRNAIRMKGVTFAVMAGGLDCLYPSGNQELFEQISQSGLLISEMTPGARPTRWRFLQRNRLIAALSETVVVTEAGYRSGSINTAGHALELGKPVLALPGPITSPTSAGCNRLIQDGKATILTDVEDLPILLGWRTPKQETEEVMGSLELRLFDALSVRSQEIERLAALAGLSNHEMQLAIGGLELQGLVNRDGNRLSKVRKTG